MGEAGRGLEGAKAWEGRVLREWGMCGVKCGASEPYKSYRTCRSARVPL